MSMHSRERKRAPAVAIAAAVAAPAPLAVASFSFVAPSPVHTKKNVRGHAEKFIYLFIFHMYPLTQSTFYTRANFIRCNAMLSNKRRHRLHSCISSVRGFSKLIQFYLNSTLTITNQYLRNHINPYRLYRTCISCTMQCYRPAANMRFLSHIFGFFNEKNTDSLWLNFLSNNDAKFTTRSMPCLC